MDQTAADHTLSADLFEALVPLLGVVHNARTLSAGKVGVLRALTERGPTTSADLTRLIGVSQQGISLATKELEAAGFVSRRRDEQDKRRTWFDLTPAGAERLATEIETGRTALQQRIDAVLRASDLATVRAALPLLRKMGEEVPNAH